MTIAPLPLILVGASGRMGAEIRRLVAGDPSVRPMALVDRQPGPQASVHESDTPWFASLGDVSADPGTVVCDFSSPALTVQVASTCAQRGWPLVSGTTGLSDMGRAALQTAAESVPVLWAPNMSVGVHLLLELVTRAAAALGDGFDAEVLEIHHRHKRDAPSGTALRLIESLAAARSNDAGTDVVSSRVGDTGPRRPGSLGVQALRGGDVAGDHTVYFLGDGERLELTHRATHRQPFAAGAVRACRWLSSQTPGLYSMNDVLGLGFAEERR